MKRGENSPFWPSRKPGFRGIFSMIYFPDSPSAIVSEDKTSLLYCDERPTKQCACSGRCNTGRSKIQKIKASAFQSRVKKEPFSPFNKTSYGNDSDVDIYDLNL